MSTLSTANIQSKAANTPPVIKDLNGTECGQFVRAWVNFDGDPVGIRDSFNVSSITENGGGDYTVNFTTNMSSASYVPLFTNIVNNSATSGTNAPGVRMVSSLTAVQSSLTVSGVRMMYRAINSNLDADMYGVAIFGG